MRYKLAIATVLGNTILFAAVANFLIGAKESQLANGRMILIETQQFDPRSLLQGDYMALSFPICEQIAAALPVDARGEGHAVVRLEENEIARFVSLHSGENLAADELLLHYRIRFGRRVRVRVCAEEFFFQEGLAEEFQRARYAELRIDDAGRSLLVALRDADLVRVKAKK